MTHDALEERILEMIRTCNARNIYVGKKTIYSQKWAAVTTVQKAINRLLADGSIVMEPITLPRGMIHSLVIADPGRTAGEVIAEQRSRVIAYRADCNGDKLDKILAALEKIEAQRQEILDMVRRMENERGNGHGDGEDGRD